jgi:hypothetical protein
MTSRNIASGAFLASTTILQYRAVTSITAALSKIAPSRGGLGDKIYLSNEAPVDSKK